MTLYRQAEDLIAAGVMCVGVGLDSKHVIKRLEAAGWVLNRVAGSHPQFRHPSRPGTDIVQHPRRDVPTGTRKSIERQSGVNLGE